MYMKSQGSYRHLYVDWVGESSTQSITLCGVEGEDIGTGQTLCPDCAQVDDALNVCGLGPESLRELFDTLRVIGPSEVKARMEALRGLWGAAGYVGSGASQLDQPQINRIDSLGGREPDDFPYHSEGGDFLPIPIRRSVEGHKSSYPLG